MEFFINNQPSNSEIEWIKKIHSKQGFYSVKSRSNCRDDRCNAYCPFMLWLGRPQSAIAQLALVTGNGDWETEVAHRRDAWAWCIQPELTVFLADTLEVPKTVRGVNADSSESKMNTHPLVGWSARRKTSWLYKANYCGVPRIVLKAHMGLGERLNLPLLVISALSG